MEITVDPKHTYGDYDSSESLHKVFFNQLEGIHVGGSKISQIKYCSMKWKIQWRKDMLKNNVSYGIKCILTEID